MTNSREKALFLTSIKELIYGERKKEIAELLSQNKIDWLRFKKIVIYHGLLPFIYLVLKDFSSLLPQDLIECLKDVGFLDEDFNLFMEDVDMAIRCRRKGSILAGEEPSALNS